MRLSSSSVSQKRFTAYPLSVVGVLRRVNVPHALPLYARLQPLLQSPPLSPQDRPLATLLLFHHAPLYRPFPILFAVPPPAATSRTEWTPPSSRLNSYNVAVRRSRASADSA